MTSGQLGIALMVLSTVLGAVGTVLQKLALDSLPPFESRPVKESARALLTRPRWLLGWALTSLGILLNIVALGMGELTVLQPLLGLGLVVLAGLSHRYLGERLGKREVAGMVVAIGGVVWLGLATGTAAPAALALGNYVTPRALVFYAVAAVGIAVPWVLCVRAGYRGAGVVFALLSAGFSVLGFTFAKGVSGSVDALGAAAAGEAAVWALAACFLVCTTMAIVLQQLSLQKGRAVVAVPLFNLGSMVLPVAPGVLLFDEGLTTERLAALATIVAGAALLSVGRRPTAPH